MTRGDTSNTVNRLVVNMLVVNRLVVNMTVWCEVWSVTDLSVHSLSHLYRQADPRFSSCLWSVAGRYIGKLSHQLSTVLVSCIRHPDISRYQGASLYLDGTYLHLKPS